MKYHSVIVTSRGSPEVLKIVENDLRAPRTGEARIKVLTVPVTLPDVQARYGQSPFKLKIPFTPGYAVIGIIDAIGADVTHMNVGDRVAAFMSYGGYAEYVYWNAAHLIPVPSTLDPAEAVTLMLNYLVAYQTL